MAWKSMACCDLCWIERQGGREPVRLREPDAEECCYCGEQTLSGIYVRENTDDVPYPRHD
jgi:hypothetical protein